MLRFAVVALANWPTPTAPAAANAEVPPVAFASAATVMVPLLSTLSVTTVPVPPCGHAETEGEGAREGSGVCVCNRAHVQQPTVVHGQIDRPNIGEARRRRCGDERRVSERMSKERRSRHRSGDRVDRRVECNRVPVLEMPVAVANAAADVTPPDAAAPAETLIVPLLSAVMSTDEPLAPWPTPSAVAHANAGEVKVAPTAGPPSVFTALAFAETSIAPLLSRDTVAGPEGAKVKVRVAAVAVPPKMVVPAVVL